MVEDNLLADLQGRACESPKCTTEDSFLGKLVGVRNVDLLLGLAIMDISVNAVCYRCKTCRRRYGVTHGHPLFAASAFGHGAHSASSMISAMWGYVEGKSATVVSSELDVHPDFVTLRLAMSRIIAADDAVAR